MKYMSKYAISYDIERKRNESMKKPIVLRKRIQTEFINYEEILKKYLEGKISKEEVKKFQFNKIVPAVSDELFIDFFMKYYNIEPISINEIDKAAELTGQTVDILKNDLASLYEYSTDVKKHERDIRKIYSDNDENVSDNVKKYISKYYATKVKSVESSLNFYLHMFNKLTELKKKISKNDFRNIDQLAVEYIENKEFAPFSDFYFNRLKKYLKLHKRISKLIIQDGRIKRLHELANKKILCLDYSDKFNKEYEFINAKNQKRVSRKLEVYINDDCSDKINNEIISVLNGEMSNNVNFYQKVINNINLVDPILFSKYIKKINGLTDISKKDVEIMVSSIEKFLLINQGKINLLESYIDNVSENSNNIKSVYVPGESNINKSNISIEEILISKISKLNDLERLYKDTSIILKSYLSFVEGKNTIIFNIDFSKVDVNDNEFGSYIKNIENTISKYEEYYNIFIEEEKNKKLKDVFLCSDKTENLTEEKVINILNKKETQKKLNDDKTVKKVIESVSDYVDDKCKLSKETIIKYLKDNSELIDTDTYTKALCKYYGIDGYEKDELDKLLFTLEYFMKTLSEKQQKLIEYGENISDNEINIRCIYVEGDENYSPLTKNNINKYYKAKLSRLKEQIEELQDRIIKITNFKEQLNNNCENINSISFKQGRLNIDFLEEYIYEFKNISRAFNFVQTKTNSDKELKLKSLKDHIIKG